MLTRTQEQNLSFSGQYILDYSFQDMANLFEGLNDDAVF
jgi:hypothetical protein